MLRANPKKGHLDGFVRQATSDSVNMLFELRLPSDRWVEPIALETVRGQKASLMPLRPSVLR